MKVAWRSVGKSHTGIIYVQPDRKDNIGMVVGFMEFLHLAVEGRAANLEHDVYSSLYFL